MKRNHLFRISLILIVALSLIYFQGCKKKGKLGIADDVLEAINQSPLGLKIEAEPGSVTIEPSGNRRQITFKNPAISLNTSVFKDLMIVPKLKSTHIPIRVKEMAVIYGPKEKYLQMVSINGFRMELSAGELGGDFTVNIDRMNFKNYFISALLTNRNADLFSLITKIMSDSQPMGYVCENISARIIVKEGQKKTSLRLKMDRVESNTRMIPDFLLSLYKKEPFSFNLSRILEQGLSIYDVNTDLTNLEISVQVDNDSVVDSELAQLQLKGYFKPNETRMGFTYGFDFRIKDLVPRIPKNRFLEMVLNVKDAGFSFAIDNLSSDFIRKYFELVRTLMSQSGDKEKMQQEQVAMAMQMAGDFFNSKPVFKLRLSPFSNILGEIEGEAAFQFPSIMGPVGTAKVDIPNLNGILKRIKTENLLPLQDYLDLEKYILKSFAIDKQGNGSFNLEIKPDEPGKVFINGKLQDQK